MKPLGLPLFVTVLCLLAPALLNAQTAQITSSPLPGGQVGELFRQVNGFRASIGCRALAWHEGAAAVAEAHSADMAKRRYFDHFSPEGESFVERLAEAGVEYRGAAAENLALSPAGPDSAMELWLESPPHRKNLEYCSYTHQGIGVADGAWTQILLAHPIPGP